MVIVVTLVEKLIDMVGNLRRVDPAELLVDGSILITSIVVLAILIGNN